MVELYAVKIEKGIQDAGLSTQLVRYVATTYGSFNDKDIVIRRTPAGKPFINNAPNFHFSLSHAGQWLVCATSKQSVGIDIEYVLPLDVLQYREYLSIAEYYQLRELPAKEQLNRFYELWTLKESYLKQTGDGLSVRMDAFSVLLNSGDLQLFFDDGSRAEGIFFRQYTLDNEYKMAVCATGNSFSEINVIPLSHIIAS